MPNYKINATKRFRKHYSSQDYSLKNIIHNNTIYKKYQVLVKLNTIHPNTILDKHVFAYNFPF